MSEYLSPGVYIEEVEVGSRPIEGVSTSTAGFLGETERGPTNPVFITSFLEYQRVFGSYFRQDKYLPHAVQGFFENGGQRCYVGRIVKTGSSEANLKLYKNRVPALTVEAVGEGTWGNRIAVKVTRGTLNGFKLSVSYWKKDEDLKALLRPAVSEVFDNLSIDEMSPNYYEKQVNGISNLIRIHRKDGDTGEFPECENCGQVQIRHTTKTITLSEEATGGENEYNGKTIMITKGKGQGGIYVIDRFNVNSKTVTIDRDLTADKQPDSTSTYIVASSMFNGSGTVDNSDKKNITLTGVTGTENFINKKIVIFEENTENIQVNLITKYENGKVTLQEEVLSSISSDSLKCIVIESELNQGNVSVKTVTLTSQASSTDDTYNGMFIEIIEGKGSGQVRKIIDYIGAEQLAIVDTPWDRDKQPDNTSSYILFNVLEQGSNVSRRTIQLAENATGGKEVYHGKTIMITNGKGQGGVYRIEGYDENSKTVTINLDLEADKQPDSSSTYIIAEPKYRGNGIVNGSNKRIITLNGVIDTENLTGKKIVVFKENTNNIQVNLITAYSGGKATLQSEVLDSLASVSPCYILFDSDPVIEGSIREPQLVQKDYLRTDTDKPGERKGLTAFTEIDQISILYSPNAKAVEGLIYSLITHCESLKDRFLIIDSPLGHKNIQTLDPRDQTATGCHDTKYAALYSPWIKVIDPEQGKIKTIPPGGHIAGIYARSDTERGVHKAPANEVVRGAVDLEFHFTKREQDMLNPRGVNIIRSFPGRGFYVWGARTVSSNTLWKYINVRRLFNFLEESIEEGTQWVVFEPNDEKLWARVKLTITEFLTRVWRDGALMGSKPEEAFFVKIDRTTMTQNDIDNGKLIALIGIAPVKPAEFVIFRIAQVPSGSKITEV